MKKLRKQLLTASVTLMVCLAGGYLTSCGEDMVVYKLNTNGGEKIANVELKEGKKYELPTPTREGYAFEGWYTNAECSGEPVTTIVAKNNATYYAKWSKLYTITLNVNGGTLSVSTLQLKEGENISEFMKTYVPEKEGFVFGDWFIGDSSTPLLANVTMTGDITLTAKYKVGYTVKMYKQTISQDGYAEPEISIEYDYPGTKVLSESVPTGFKEIKHDNTVYEIVLSENSAQNVIQRYFDRESYTVTFHPNYPNGEEGRSQSQTVVYGEEVSIPTNFAAMGYCLLGWATSATGEVVYKANYIQSALFNEKEDTEEEEKKETYLPTRNTSFYAVWKKGYIDMFGGGDYLYILDENSDEIYLSRGDVFFKGTYDSETKEFEFVGEKFYKSGRVNEEGSFFYQNKDHAISRMLLVVGKGIVDTTTVSFDDYNGIKYSVKGEDGKTDVSDGSYYVDESGYYIATFTEGSLAGKTLTFVVGEVSLDNKTISAFQLRDDEEYNMGELVSYIVVNGRLNYYTGGVYSIKLSGFGTAAYNTGSEMEGYIYTREGDVLTLYTDSGSVHGVYRLIEDNGAKGYIPYDQTMDQTFTLDSGDTLTLDGTCNATYLKGDTSLKGYYSARESLIGKTLVSVYVGSETYIFHVFSETKEVEIEGKTSTVTEYVADEKLATYREFFYRDAQGVYYAPMLVINEKKEGEAILYGFTNNGTHEIVSYGTYEYDDATGLYTYTVDPESFTGNEVIDQPLDISSVVKIEFAIIDQEPFYSASYWYSIETDIEGEKEEKDFENTYTREGDVALTLVGGIAFYNGSVGEYSVAGKDTAYPGLVAVRVAGSVFYVELDDENKTYVKLDHAPYTAKIWVDGSASKTEAFALDGKGGATYSIQTDEKDSDGKAIVINYVGTYVKTDKTTAFGYYVFKFTGTDGEETKEFEFIQFTGSSSAYVALKKDDYTGEYRAEDGELVLDGFGYKAKFTSAEGDVYEALYVVEKENVIMITTEDAYFYFDIQDNTKKTFTLRGLEAGTYVVVDNQSLSKGVVELDGYGKLILHNWNDETTEEGIVGSYEVKSDEIVLYWDDVELHGALSYMAIGDAIYNTFVIDYDTFATSFVNEDDWSVIMFNGYGNAIKYGESGSRETGAYTIVSENLFYYENSAGKDGGLYTYDLTTGRAKPVSLNATYYYTEDLRSLRFTKWGYAVFDGEEIYYYNIEDGKVFIYEQDAENNKANAYGFVKTEFGDFDDVKEWGDKTYYMNDGFALTFKISSDSEKYTLRLDEFADPGKPLESLTFAPSGDEEFSVSGHAKFNGSDTVYDCVITRQRNEQGELEMFVSIDYYYLDITVKYNGAEGTDNTFATTRSRRSASYLSYMYMDMYYMLYTYLGASMADSFPNQYGMIILTEDLNKLCMPISKTITGVFGSFSSMYDTKGNLLGFEEVKDGEGYEEFNWDPTFQANGYKVTFTGEDDYVYHVYLTLQQHSAFGLYGYSVLAVTREEVIESNGYTLIVEKVIATEFSKYEVGEALKVVLKKADEVIYEGALETIGDTTYCVVREALGENEWSVKTEYYEITLIDVVSASMEESEIVALYDLTKCSVVCKSATTYYAAKTDGENVSVNQKTYLDVLDGNVPVKLVISGNIVEIVKAFAYDADTNTYTMTMVSGVKYSVTIDEDGVMTWTTITDDEGVEE